MIIISKVPSRPLKENALRVSRWNSSRHPVMFEFWRVDVVIQNYVDNGGLLTIIANLSQTAALTIVTGAQIYVRDFSGNYDTAGTVTLADTSNGFNYYFETDIPFNGTPVLGGYLNILTRESYYVEVEVLGTDPISQVQRVWATLRTDPDPSGFGELNIQSALNGYLRKQNTFNYTSKNQLDRMVYGRYKLRYTGKWINGQEPVTYTDGTDYYFVDATKYLLNAYGQNFADHLPFNDDTLVEKAKFLCDFTKPTYFVGYPFDLSCIIPEFVGNSIGCVGHEDMFVAGGVSIGVQTEALNLFKTEAVQRIRLKGAFDPTVREIDFWLQASDVPEENYYLPGYIDSGYYETLGGSAITPFRITEKKRIKVNQDCVKLGVYLAWRGSKGWNYWLFKNTQEINIATKVEGVFASEPTDLEFAMSRETTTTTNTQEKMTLGGQVALEDVSGFRYFEGSPCIQMLVSQDPLQWITVKISPKGVKFRTDAPYVNIEFDIILPQYYTVPN